MATKTIFTLSTGVDDGRCVKNSQLEFRNLKRNSHKIGNALALLRKKRRNKIKRIFFSHQKEQISAKIVSCLIIL